MKTLADEFAYKAPHLRDQFNLLSPLLQRLAYLFIFYSRRRDVETVVTRISDPAGPGITESGVHLAGRAIDFRDKQQGAAALYGWCDRRKLLKLFAAFERTDGKPTLLHHGKVAGEKHWHLQVPWDNSVFKEDPFVTLERLEAKLGITIFKKAGEVTSYSNDPGSFNAAAGTGASIADSRGLAIDSSGRLYVGGAFTSFSGTTRNRFLRINSDGTADATYYTNLGSAFNNIVQHVLIQADGKAVVVGQFTTFNGATRNRIVRLNDDGTEDATFATNIGTAANNTVSACVQQSDGKLIVGGFFTSWNGNTRGYFVRLNTDGTEDSTFATNTGTGANNSAFFNSIALQSTGKIILCGQFTAFNGTSINRIIRLNSDGTEDTAFTTNIGTGFSLTTAGVSVQSNDKIIVPGDFATFNGNARNRLVRLNADGTEDTAFYTKLGSGFSARVSDTFVQENDSILCGGLFTTFNGNTRNRLARLLADGTEDEQFASAIGTGSVGQIQTIERLGNKIYAVGQFATFNGNDPAGLVELSSVPGVAGDAFSIESVVNIRLGG